MDLEAWLSLVSIDGRKVSRAAIMERVRSGASPGSLLAAPSGELEGLPLVSLVNHDLVGRWLRRMAASATDFIPFTSSLIPLAAVPRWPPLGLFVRGRMELLDRPGIAIVGRRRATVAGCALAREIARRAADAGLVIVSGLAEGIDGAAHRGALDAGGDTIAVLGAGPDVAYPEAHRALHEEIAARGLLVSEYPPGTMPRTSQFPVRNRIVVALSRAVVVVEAGARSGALITANVARRAGVPILAVPGSPGVPESAGTNVLLKRGLARMVEGPEDVLAALAAPRPQGQPIVGVSRSVERASRPVGRASRASSAATGLGEAGLRLYAALGRRGTSIDELAAALGWTASDVLVELVRLEIAGLAAPTDGGVAWRRSGA